MTAMRAGSMRIEKTSEIGLCFGVRRAIDIVEKAAREHGGVETLGAVAHNRQVVRKLAEIGVRVASDIDDIKGDIVAISSHGISPQLEEEIQSRHINIINATCPFVRRAQIAARRLARSGFLVVVYGDADHPEVKGVLGWADGNGIATLDDRFLVKYDHPPRRLGVLSQTTQIPVHFMVFIKKLIDSALDKDSEFRIIDTICHDTRNRQTAALELADKADLMLVIGSYTSANTNRLAELCSAAAQTHLVETADAIQPSWLKGKKYIGVTAGASTAEQTVDEVIARLGAMIRR